ncbi:MAG: hypothetical protein II969_06335 [Anaerolineaceae bacterium]|nr:hypothetical protein [Anaerolineaceae bacterium]
MEQKEINDCKTLLESIRGDIRLIRSELEHMRELNESRLKAIEKICEDHEARLRDVSTGVTQFRFWSSVTSGGSTAMSLLALVKSFVGSRF